MGQGTNLGAAHDGGKHGTWCVITSKAGFAHTRPVVNNLKINKGNYKN